MVNVLDEYKCMDGLPTLTEAKLLLSYCKTMYRLYSNLVLIGDITLILNNLQIWQQQYSV